MVRIEDGMPQIISKEDYQLALKKMDDGVERLIAGWTVDSQRFFFHYNGQLALQSAI